ncbi:hypothetical protein A2U01_0050533, partial [Trifolium medium]|nr:hypothetical protein [Trifolium medium]
RLVWSQARLREYGRHSGGRRGCGEACMAVLKSKDSWRQAFLREDGEVHSGVQRRDSVNLWSYLKNPMVAGGKIFKRAKVIPWVGEVEVNLVGLRRVVGCKREVQTEKLGSLTMVVGSK